MLLTAGAIAYGAFSDGKAVGFIYLGTNLFGKEKQYIELKMFHISNGYRNNGIGKKLVAFVRRDALLFGLEKLYISAHSAKESQEAYAHMGCALAKEVNQELADNEPWDIQMEYVL